MGPSDGRILVIQHESEAGPDWLGGWLIDAGHHLEIRRPDAADRLPRDPAGVDALVVLGGAMGANDDAEYPWLTPTKALIRAAVADGIPFLGLCLGHQLAAVALGGDVGRNPSGRQIGLVPVALTDAGHADPLLQGLDAAPAVHWNDDVVLDPPPGSTILATLPDDRVQALRLGECAWGLQFHPEASPTTFAAWGATGPEHTDPGHARRRREVAAAAASLEQAWSTLAGRFAQIVSASVRRRRGGDPPPTL